jgi:NADH:ubiquinone oxidoreductase subunit E
VPHTSGLPLYVVQKERLAWVTKKADDEVTRGIAVEVRKVYEAVTTGKALLRANELKSLRLSVARSMPLRST